MPVYNECSFQVKYRRKIFEQIALLAYSNAKEALYRLVPKSVVTEMAENTADNEVTSDLDYAAESCCAALGLEPVGYKDLFLDNMGGEHGKAMGKNVLCTLKSVCHKCANIQGRERPCAKACMCDAIKTDSLGSTVIDGTKCDSCGRCLLACPYGAIIDKSAIVQVIQEIHNGRHTYAILTPGLSQQFSTRFSEMELTEAFRILGFYDVVELDDEEESPRSGKGSACIGWRAEECRNHISCCVSKIEEYRDGIRDEILYVCGYDPNACFVLVTPCVISKIEGVRLKDSLYVSYVLDFEELAGMLEARGVEKDLIRPFELESLKHISCTHI